VVAQRISQTINNARRMNLFYVRSVRHSWSTDDGWSASIEAVNFIEPRSLAKNMSKTAKDQDAEVRKKKAGSGKTAAQIAQEKAARAVNRAAAPKPVSVSSVETLIFEGVKGLPTFGNPSSFR
jgi:hypothetical protein